MRKIIRIGSKDFEMAASAYTQFKYKDLTGRSLVKDLTMLGEKFKGVEQESEILERWEELEEFLTMTLRIAYIMTSEADSHQIGSFEDFLKQVDGYMNDISWFSDVITLALSPLSGQV